MALFRPAAGKAVTVFTIEQMLAYRDTWTERLDIDVEEKILQQQQITSPASPTSATTPLLQMSEQGFRHIPANQMSKDEVLVRNVQSILNKLVHENFESLVPTILQPALFDSGVAAQVVDKIFRKSLEEPKYSMLYATLCLRLAQYEHTVFEGGKVVRTSIISCAQQVYEAQMLPPNDEDGEEEDAAGKLRKRKLANIQFVAHLFHHGLLAPRIIVMIARSIATQNPPEIDVEVVVTLLDRVGEFFDNCSAASEEANPLDAVYASLDRLQVLPREEGGYSMRVKFMMMDLNDLRASGWQRRENDDAAEPMTPCSPVTAGAVAQSLAFSAACLDQRGPVPPDMQYEDRLKVIAKLERIKEDSVEVYKFISTFFKDLNATLNRVACLAHAIDAACQSPKEDLRVFVRQALRHSAIDPAETRAALAWAATNAIVCCVREDCPKYFDRFADVALKSARVSIADKGFVCTAVKDSFVPVAANLDAVYVSMDGTKEWDEEYINLWGSWFTEVAKLPADNRPQLGALMEGMCGIKAQGIAGRTLTDVIDLIAGSKLCSYDDIGKWHASHAKTAEYKVLVNAASMLV